MIRKLKSEIYKGHKVMFIKHDSDVLAVLHIKSENVDITEYGKTKEQAFSDLKKKIKGFSAATRKCYDL